MQFSPGLKGELNLRHDATDKPRYPGTHPQGRKGVVKYEIVDHGVVQSCPRSRRSCEGRRLPGAPSQMAVPRPAVRGSVPVTGQRFGKSIYLVRCSWRVCFGKAVIE